MIYTCIDCNRTTTASDLPDGWEDVTDAEGEYTIHICDKCIQQAEYDDVGYGGLTGCRDYCERC